MRLMKLKVIFKKWEETNSFTDWQMILKGPKNSGEKNLPTTLVGGLFKQGDGLIYLKRVYMYAFF